MPHRRLNRRRLRFIESEVRAWIDEQTIADRKAEVAEVPE
jgi:predicted DNA-binding transcriptional regulator AlpA